jgi:hypothetical protein
MVGVNGYFHCIVLNGIVNYIVTVINLRTEECP